jgi:PmbA protein
LNQERLAAEMLDRLVRNGAGRAEVFLEWGDRLRIRVRRQKVEYLKQESFQGMGLRVYMDQRMAFVDSADFSEKTLELLARKAVELAAMAGSDPSNGLPEKGPEVTSQEVVDQRRSTLSLDDKLARVMETERLAMDYHPMITLSNGASYTDLHRRVTILNTEGLARSYEETKFSLDVSVVATEENQKKDGSDICRRRRYIALRTPGQMAQIAGQMAVSLVGGKPVPSQQVPVVFSPQAGRGLIGGLAEGIDGKEVHLGNSFLAGKLGQPVASELVTIVDDGTLLQGVGSAPVDGEGVATRRTSVVERGTLRAYLYDTYGARKTGHISTGNGMRGSYKNLPAIGVTNFLMFAGTTPPAELVQELDRGLYVAETIGFGVNTTTGGYSAGVFGRWIEKGRLSQPVAQVTVAGDMLDILAGIDAVGDDLKFDHRISCPSFRVAKMTVAGT